MLRADAEADGHRQMTRLASELALTPQLFHPVLAAYIDNSLAGIGAITDEPQPMSEPAWRMRRLYVHRQFRRRGVGRAIASELLKEAASKVRIVTVHAGTANAASFWEALGFRQAACKAWSHETIISPALTANWQERHPEGLPCSMGGASSQQAARFDDAVILSAAKSSAARVGADGA
jgi:GNAT superfamily N-acetyltransferase